MPKKTADSVADAVLDEDTSDVAVESTPDESVESAFARLYAEACKPFDKTFQRQIAGGKTLTYITTEQAISRLQEVYGPTWEWSLGTPIISGDDIIVVGTLTVKVKGVYITRDGAGGSKIATRRDTGAVMDLGNNFKAAESSALKRAAAKFGVGLYLYERTDEPDTQQYTPRPQGSQATPYFPPQSQGQPIQFGTNNSTGGTTTGPVEAVSLPRMGDDGKQKLGGLKVNGQWYNVSNRAPFTPSLGMKGQVVTIMHPEGQTFIDSVNFGGTAVADQIEAF